MIFHPSFQLSLDPVNLMNVIPNNNAFFLTLFNLLGLYTITKASKPLTDWLKVQLKESEPDENGFFIERYLAEKKKNEEEGNSEATFHGEGGEGHILGTLLDLFLAG